MIRCRTLGALELTDSSGREYTAVLAQPKRVALLVYLAAANPRGFHRRDSLLALFWPELDQEHARAALRQALTFLRHELGDDVLRSRGAEDVGVDPERFWCDVAAIEEALQAGDLQRALELYRGDFLTGLHVAEGGEFERWLEQQRSELRHQAADVAARLVRRAEAAGSLAEAVRWARYAMTLKPDDEGTVQQLVMLLDRMGDRAAALREYEALVQHLATAYGVEPSPETQAAIAEIRMRRRPLTAVRGAIPAAVDQVIRHALNKTPADRLTTASQFAEGLRAALEAPVGVTPVSATRTPSRASRPARLTAVAATVLLLGIGALWVLWSRDTATGPGDVPRLVVLPFENLGVPEDEYFVQGMTDEVTARLAGLTGLAVIARQSAMLYKGSGKTPQQIAAELDADYLLEATVSWQRSPQGPSRVRIRPQLIRARDASHVWADVFDEDLTDVFAVQASIASRVVQALDVALLDRERQSLAKVPTANAQAHDDFLRASFLFAQRDRQMLNRALEGFRRALELDPAFSAARAGIAMTYAQMADYGWVPADLPLESLLAAGLASADSLIAQDHDSPDAWVARGYLLEQFGDHRLTEARAAFETAISLDPRHVEAHNRLGWVFLALGRDSAALAQARATLNLDPTWHVPYYLLGRVAFLNGELSRAETVLDSVVFLDPSHAGGRTYRARVRLLIGDTAGARADAALAGAHSTLARALIDAATGRRLPALTAVEHVLKNDPRADLLDAAMVYTALGSHENARDLLERAWDRPHFWRQLDGPNFVGLREHPWFDTLFIRARQRATGS